jgi:NADH:ubiquinone oxidoreductase subunit 6 (subunit J)
MISVQDGGVTRSAKRRLMLAVVGVSMALGAVAASAPIETDRQLVVLATAVVLAVVADRMASRWTPIVQSPSRRHQAAIAVVGVLALLILSGSSGVGAALGWGIFGGTLVGVLRRLPMKPTNA